MIMKPLSELETCVILSQDTVLNKDVAKKVAQNLFNYMTSFGEISNSADN